MRATICSPRVAMRIADLLEDSFADAEMCTLVTFPDGSGVSETRRAFNRKYKPGRVVLAWHPDGRMAVGLNAAARTKFMALRAAIAARRAAGTATDDEREIDDLPAEVDLDETWSA